MSPDDQAKFDASTGRGWFLIEQADGRVCAGHGLGWVNAGGDYFLKVGLVAADPELYLNPRHVVQVHPRTKDSVEAAIAGMQAEQKARQRAQMGGPEIVVPRIGGVQGGGDGGRGGI